MNKKKPTTEEIIRILPKADEGQTVEEDGWKAGPKFVQRIRRLEGFGIRVRGPRRGRSTASPTRAMPLNEVWNWDFVHDRTDNGVPLKMLTLIDKYSRQCLRVEVARQLKREVVPLTEPGGPLLCQAACDSTLTFCRKI